MQIPWERKEDDECVEYEAIVQKEYLANLWYYDGERYAEPGGWIFNLGLWDDGHIKSLPQQRFGKVAEPEAFKLAEAEIARASTVGERPATREDYDPPMDPPLGETVIEDR